MTTSPTSAHFECYVPGKAPSPAGLLAIFLTELNRWRIVQSPRPGACGMAAMVAGFRPPRACPGMLKGVVCFAATAYHPI